MRLAGCGLLPALSVTLSEAVRVPIPVGEKFTLILHCAPGASESRRGFKNEVDGTAFAVGIGSHGPASAGGRRVSGTTVPVRDNSR